MVNILLGGGGGGGYNEKDPTIDFYKDEKETPLAVIKFSFLVASEYQRTMQFKRLVLSLFVFVVSLVENDQLRLLWDNLEAEIARTFFIDNF